jgi:hypothetical protein
MEHDLSPVSTEGPDAACELVVNPAPAARLAETE